jgi:hypothetical protein
MRFKSGAYTVVREHFEAHCNTATGQKMKVFKQFNYLRQNSGTTSMMTVKISSLPSNMHQMSSHLPKSGIRA